MFFPVIASGAKQPSFTTLDYFVAALLATTLNGQI